MFTDAFDSVRTQVALLGEEESKNNSIYSEISLFQLLLSGEIPNLTPAQILDSSAFFNITSSNRNTFLDLMNDKFISITLFPGEKSLRHHFLKCLNKGLDNKEELYAFSIFPFLTSYSENLRKDFQKHLISVIQDQYFDFSFDGINSEHSEYMEEVFDNFQVIDVLTYKNLKQKRSFSQNISPLVLQICNEIVLTQENEEFNNLFSELKADKNGDTINTFFRSTYYGFLDRVKTHYSTEIINQLRKIVDIAYNIAIASSIDDTDGSKISSDLSLLHTSNILSELKPKVKTTSEITIQTNQEKSLTWEIVYEILKEVKSLSNDKKISYKQALVKYKNHNKISDTFSICKYVAYSSLKTLLPGGEFLNIAVNVASDVALNAGTELLDTKLHQLSVSELVEKIKTNHKKRQIVTDTIKKIQYNENTYLAL